MTIVNQVTVVSGYGRHGYGRHGRRAGRSGIILLVMLAWVIAQFWLLGMSAAAVLVALALRIGRPDDITMTEIPGHLWIVDLRQP